MTETSEGRTLQEIVDQELEVYDLLESDTRFTILYLLNEVGGKYKVTVIAPLLGDVHPAEMIREAAQYLRAEIPKEIPQPDLAMVLTDSWGYPKEVLTTLGGKDLDTIQRLVSSGQLVPPAKHPDRVSVSLCSIAFRDGHNETVSQTQGDLSTRRWLDDRDPTQAIEGRIPEAVRTLVDRWRHST